MEQKKIRIFVAIDLLSDITEGLKTLQNKLINECPGKIAWVKPENIHLTLKFLGEIEEGRREQIFLSLKEVTSKYSPFDVLIKGLGCFPRIENPRVVWVGIACEGDELFSLQKDVDTCLNKLGFPEDKRKYHAHLTLGRIKVLKERMRWKEIVGSFQDVEVGTLNVEKIVLFKSTLRPAGAVYTVLGEAFLRRL
ncbi:MAG: RNA 2',3'-cyclic phosphodiesterase [Thermodesulfobacteriota bacterium]